MEEEIWKTASGYEGIYEASSMGRVRSIDREEWSSQRFKKVRRRRYGKEISQNKDSEGYLHFLVSKRGIIKCVRSHRFIAKTFIPNPNNYPQVNHINGIKTDNRVCNLEWCDHKMQMSHASENGLMCKKKYTQLTEQDVISIRDEYTTVKTSHRSLAQRYGVCKSTITDIILRKSWITI